jgi:transposase
MLKMIHSEKFKSRLVAKMVGPGAVSANSLAAEVGLSQPTLSRWLREARTVPGMSKKLRGSKNGARPGRSQDWSPEEKSRVVVESRNLSEEELGAFLRKEGLYQAQLDEWAEAMHASLSAPKKSKAAAADAKRIKKLERELRRKEKALAEAAALLILQKKVQEIWGDEDDDTEPRSGK